MPGITMVVSMPKRANSAAYDTASVSIAALAAKYGARWGGVPPLVEVEPTRSTRC
ncbi:hypothetical protein [Streptomyces xantholiticus]|uniref:hypothetical protein n=1 Tax=Streptomyces xantholiticus TaxID=68285 RepID=UPI00167625F8